MLYKVLLTFESVDESLKCDHSKVSYSAVLSIRLSAIYYAVKVILTCMSVYKVNPS